MARPHIPLLQRLPKFLGSPPEEMDPNACWVWRGTLNGYKPIVVLDGKRVQARRAVYEEVVGKLQPWQKPTKPLCRQPTCVNPEHSGIIGLDPEPEIPAEFLEPPPDEPLDAEFVADLIPPGMRDAQESRRLSRHIGRAGQRGPRPSSVGFAFRYRPLTHRSLAR